MDSRCETLQYSTTICSCGSDNPCMQLIKKNRTFTITQSFQSVKQWLTVQYEVTGVQVFLKYHFCSKICMYMQVFINVGKSTKKRNLILFTLLGD